MVADRHILFRCVRGLLNAAKTERQDDHEGRCVGDVKDDAGPDRDLPSTLEEVLH